MLSEPLLNPFAARQNSRCHRGHVWSRLRDGPGPCQGRFGGHSDRSRRSEGAVGHREDRALTGGRRQLERTLMILPAAGDFPSACHFPSGMRRRLPGHRGPWAERPAHRSERHASTANCSYPWCLGRMFRLAWRRRWSRAVADVLRSIGIAAAVSGILSRCQCGAADDDGCRQAGGAKIDIHWFHSERTFLRVVSTGDFSFRS